MKNMKKISKKAKAVASALICISTSLPWVGLGWAFGLSSCSDQWNDHYAEDATLDGTLWEAIQKNSELSNFASVIEATGYDSRLASSQMFTVFAPVNANFSATEAQNLISRYQAEKQRGVKDDDNQVVRQFVQNHIALFNRSVSSLTNDSITMMNGKYEVVTGSKFGDTNFTDKNRFYTNGVLYTVDRPETYFPNVYEYLSQDGQTDSLYNFLSSYSAYEFDAETSVPGDIVNGKTVYLDSVFHLRNSMLSQYGLINREDSSYLALAPTDRVWRELFSEYINYFNYNDLTSKRDSMVLTQTRHAIARGTIFNLNQQPSLADSAVSTEYQRLYRSRSTYDEPRYYVYEQPYNGAFSGAEAITCSNGQVLRQDNWKINKRQTFLQDIKVEAEQARYQDTIVQARDPLAIRAVPMTSPFYGKVSSNYFIEAQPLSTASSTEVRYRIPDQLSNIGYDIYAVFVPAIAYDENASADDRLPNRVRMTLTYQEQDGTVTSVNLRNPADNSAYYITQADVVDSVLVASNYVFPTCALGLAQGDEQVTLDIRVNMTSAMSSTYSRTLRLDCIILRPHEED